MIPVGAFLLVFAITVVTIGVAVRKHDKLKELEKEHRKTLESYQNFINEMSASVSLLATARKVCHTDTAPETEPVEHISPHEIQEMVDAFYTSKYLN